ncbi:NAD(P)/FAD-dependent oxidoreductase [Cuniculiplasma sp. SKW4]|uniref:NAD(P)/FAD-dependent oxidoreductase n=1 Tax=Cuniculiplasma sp. SKW4 TaxID=3400171 RepID=UPI003FD1C129
MVKKMIIIGGGFAGLRFLYNLNKHMAGQFDITLIDERKTSLEKPSLPEVAMDGKSVSKVQIPFEKIIKRRKATFVNQSVVRVDPEGQKVFLKDGSSLNYDYLMIATGAIKDYDAIPGFNEYAYSVCDDVQAPKLWSKLKAFKGGKVVVGSAKTDWSPETAIPLAAPCEGPIGEVMFMVDHFLREENLRDKSSIDVFSPGEIFFEDVGEPVHNALKPLIEKSGINVHVKKEISRVEKNKVIFNDGSELESDFSIIIPPYRGPDFIRESKIGDDYGFILTDKEMRHTKYRNILVAGDVNNLSMPKLGHIAIMQADIAFSSLQKEISSGKEVEEFKPEIFCIMNRGGSQATLILSDTLFGGKNDITMTGQVAHLMKWGFDSYYYYTRGHMPPESIQSRMEKFMKR